MTVRGELFGDRYNHQELGRILGKTTKNKKIYTKIYKLSLVKGVVLTPKTPLPTPLHTIYKSSITLL